MICMLDTDQLRSFVAIVDAGSFTRAAERVNKTQSAVSMHIRRLEEQLGRALFIRQGRGVKLSEEGQQLIEYARQILEIEATALASISRRALAGRVRFGIPDDYADSFLPDIVTRFVRRHPLVEVSVICEGSMVLSERIGAREVDVAVVTSCANVHGAEILREEPLRWMVGAHYRVHDMRPLPLALSGPTCDWRRAALEALQAAGVPWRQLLVSASHAAIAPVVQAGLAATVLPGSAASHGMRIVDEDEGLPPLPNNRVGILEASGKRSPEALALAEEVRNTIRLGPSLRDASIMRQNWAQTAEPSPNPRARDRGTRQLGPLLKAVP